MKKALFVILFILGLTVSPKKTCFAEVHPAGEIERTQEILEKERALREKIEKEERFFIKRITVEGVTLLSAEEIKELILPFQRRWLSQIEMQQILDALTATYHQKGHPDQPEKISFQIKRGSLKIKAEELSH